jgi:hypothetical protein
LNRAPKTENSPFAHTYWASYIKILKGNKMQNNPTQSFNQDNHGAKTWVPRSAANKRLLIIAAMIVVGSGMAMNWSWLAAIGVAPLILLVAPCLVMCGLGMCMKCKSSGSCSKDTKTENTST